MIELLQNWNVLLIPLIVLIISQLTKIGLENMFHLPRFQNGWQRLNSYGGMPSSHTALFVSLSLVVGLNEGFDSALFVVTIFVSAAFIRDAVGIRQSLGAHGKALNHLVKTLPKDEQDMLPTTLNERLGHTIPEAVVGAVLGAVLGLLLYWALM